MSGKLSYLPNGKYSQVYGEAVLINITEESKDESYLTIVDLQNLVSKCRLSKNIFFWTKENLSYFRPALRVIRFNLVDRASELVERNLEIRALCV